MLFSVNYIFFVYLIFINTAAFITMYADKKKAERKEWRIQEKHLFLLAAIGGSLGVWLGMYQFHHKTRKLKFKIGIPSILIIQIILFIICMEWGNKIL